VGRKIIMKQLTLVPDDDPILTQQAAPVTEITPEHRDMARLMVNMIKVHNAIGLAAPQVGISIQMIAVYVKKEQKQPIIMYNPKIIETDDIKLYDSEGCLSFPDLIVDVARSRTVTVEYMDSKGKKITMKANHMMARCIQHEIDHLNGVTILDYE